MVQRGCRSNGELAQIQEIGESKIEKYAERFLPTPHSLSMANDASPRFKARIASFDLRRHMDLSAQFAAAT